MKFINSFTIDGNSIQTATINGVNYSFGKAIEGYKLVNYLIYKGTTYYFNESTSSGSSSGSSGSGSNSGSSGSGSNNISSSTGTSSQSTKNPTTSNTNLYTSGSNTTTLETIASLFPVSIKLATRRITSHVAGVPDLFIPLSEGVLIPIPYKENYEFGEAIKLYPLNKEGEELIPTAAMYYGLFVDLTEYMQSCEYFCEKNSMEDIDLASNTITPYTLTNAKIPSTNYTIKDVMKVSNYTETGLKLDFKLYTELDSYYYNVPKLQTKAKSYYYTDIITDLPKAKTFDEFTFHCMAKTGGTHTAKTSTYLVADPTMGTISEDHLPVPNDKYLFDHWLILSYSGTKVIEEIVTDEELTESVSLYSKIYIAHFKVDLDLVEPEEDAGKPRIYTTFILPDSDDVSLSVTQNWSTIKIKSFSKGTTITDAVDRGYSDAGITLKPVCSNGWVFSHCEHNDTRIEDSTYGVTVSNIGGICIFYFINPETQQLEPTVDKSEYKYTLTISGKVHCDHVEKHDLLITAANTTNTGANFVNNVLSTKSFLLYKGSSVKLSGHAFDWHPHSRWSITENGIKTVLTDLPTITLTNPQSDISIYFEIGDDDSIFNKD